MIVEQEEVISLDDEQELVDLNATESEEEEVQAEEIEQEPEFTIPDKFKDKNIEDVVKSYQQLEKEAGRRANEVGELRRLTDELLQLQLKEKQEEVTAPPELDVDLLLENPTEAINQAVNARFKSLEDKLNQQDLDKGKAAFEAKHPNWQEKLQDPTMIDWIQSSPVRLRMFQEANANYDYETADELFTMYDAIHGGVKEVAKEKATQKRTKKLQAAKTESGSTGVTSNKIYSRAELLNFRLRDPEGYFAREEEFNLARAEGRVR